MQAIVEGFKGNKCVDYIAVIEELLDADTIDSERTPEYELENQKNVALSQAVKIGR